MRYFRLYIHTFMNGIYYKIYMQMKLFKSIQSFHCKASYCLLKKHTNFLVLHIRPFLSSPLPIFLSCSLLHALLFSLFTITWTYHTVSYHCASVHLILSLDSSSFSLSFFSMCLVSIYSYFKTTRLLPPF